MGSEITLEWQGFVEEKLKGMGEGDSTEWKKEGGGEKILRVKMVRLSGV